MTATRSIFTGTVCIFGVLLLVQCQVIRSENTWQTQWQYEPKCEKNLSNECLSMHMDTTANINLTISNLNKTELQQSKATIRVVSNADVLLVSQEIPLDEIGNDGKWKRSFNIEAVFIGKADLYVEITRKDKEPEQSDKEVLVVITRPERLIDRLFIISVITLVSILYINFGAALDLRKVKSVLRRPIGPAIAFFCHFLFLPLVSNSLN